MCPSLTFLPPSLSEGLGVTLPAQGPVANLNRGLEGPGEPVLSCLGTGAHAGPVSQRHKLGVSRRCGQTRRSARSSSAQPRGKDALGPVTGVCVVT